ncbi:hypothetical protein E4U43_004967, partial [Claviceps pusilla]
MTGPAISVNSFAADFRPNDLEQNHSASDAQGTNERLSGELIPEQLFRLLVWSDSSFEHESLNILVPGVQDIFEVEDTDLRD